MMQIALLRGINVGGRKKVAMADLRTVCERLGFTDVKSLLQSGNLVFRGDRRPAADVEDLLRAESVKRLSLDAEFFVRSAKEWTAIVAANPFPRAAAQDPAHLVLMCLKEAPVGASVEALQAAIAGPEIIRAKGRHLYIVFPTGIGTSRLTNALIEKRLGTRGTARNWNTVLKLAALTTAHA
jgi:uncharacterized protein (DUF1697 family)